MNRTLRLRAFVPLLAVLGLGCSGSPPPTPAPPAELANFQIVVGMTDDGIVLQCTDGCAWVDLSFSVRPYAAEVAVDNAGMADASASAQSPDSFLFTVQKTEEGIRLRGIHGSAWTELSFSCAPGACSVPIDEMGMA